MAHHKRGRPKSSRAGCLLCKPHKHQGRKKTARSKRAQAILAEPVSFERFCADMELRRS